MGGENKFLFTCLQSCWPGWRMPYLLTIGRFKFFRWVIGWLMKTQISYSSCGQFMKHEYLTNVTQPFKKNTNILFQLWTVPEQGRFSYNLVVFAKGGIIYRSFYPTWFDWKWKVKCVRKDIWCDQRLVRLMSLCNLACYFSSFNSIIALQNIFPEAASNATWLQTTSTGRTFKCFQISSLTKFQCIHLWTMTWSGTT